jgi:hypothetical protein
LKGAIEAKLSGRTVTSVSGLLSLVGEALRQGKSTFEPLQSLPSLHSDSFLYLNDLELLGSLSVFSVHVPLTLDEISTLGTLMKNCLRGSPEAFTHAVKETQIIALCMGGPKNPEYVVEVGPCGKIMTMTAKCNNAPPEHLKSKLQEVLTMAWAKSQDSGKDAPDPTAVAPLSGLKAIPDGV